MHSSYWRRLNKSNFSTQARRALYWYLSQCDGFFNVTKLPSISNAALSITGQKDEQPHCASSVARLISVTPRGDTDGRPNFRMSRYCTCSLHGTTNNFHIQIYLTLGTLVPWNDMSRDPLVSMQCDIN